MMTGMSTESTDDDQHLSDSTTADDDQHLGEPTTADETTEMLRRLRSAPADELVTELISTLLSTAHVKLGRRDARLFIDLCALMVGHAGQYLPDELSAQVDSTLGQLRFAQVSAESEVAAGAEPELNDLSQVPSPPA
jgi:hypothetical protein